jgi:hypothetical protein
MSRLEATVKDWEDWEDWEAQIKIPIKFFAQKKFLLGLGLMNICHFKLRTPLYLINQTVLL